MAGIKVQIDGAKLKELVDAYGGAKLLSNNIGVTENTMQNYIKGEYIAAVKVHSFEKELGISIDDLKKAKEEQAQQVMTELPKLDGDWPKEIAVLLREMCNNQLALYRRVNQLTEEVIKVREEIEAK